MSASAQSTRWWQHGRGEETVDRRAHRLKRLVADQVLRGCFETLGLASACRRQRRRLLRNPFRVEEFIELYGYRRADVVTESVAR